MSFRYISAVPLQGECSGFKNYDMKSWIGRWKAAGRERIGLDVILGHAAPQSPLEERLEWLIELFQWLRSPGSIEVARSDQHKTGIIQATRIRYLLIVLEKNPNWKTRVSATLRSILRDTNAVNLFCASGLPAESSFFSEAVDRFMRFVLPEPPHEDDLSVLFAKLFASVDDILWLERLDAVTLREIWSLFTPAENDQGSPGTVGEKIKVDMEESLLFLTGQVRTYGLEPKIRRRMSNGRIQSLPFFEITFAARTLIQNLHNADLFSRREAIANFREVIARCRKELNIALGHLDEYGVSVAIVYQLDRIRSLLNRVEMLVRVLAGENVDPTKIVAFLCNLINEIHKQRSLRSLFSENLSLLSMKIAQRSAETGSHYIAKTRDTYLSIFSKAAGGGFITAFTALLKVFLESFRHSAYFFQGFLYSLNYSISFIWIYIAGFTLATKQPAMTANALAAQMENLDSAESQTKLVDEVVNLIRSQGAATLGNLAAVIPTILAVDTIIFFLSGDSVMSPVHGIEILDAHSAWGMSPLHAAFTGVLLWLSSIIAGWVDNWAVYREIPKALIGNRRLKKLIGVNRLAYWAGLFKTHLAGLTGNVALGFLLGMTPKIMGFFGVPLDVRHVTLSTGVIAFAASSIGIGALTLPALWWAVLGVVVIGVMNISVSFFLALFVALRSRRIDARLRDVIYGLVWQRFLRNPISFFWFPKSKDAT